MSRKRKVVLTIVNVSVLYLFFFLCQERRQAIHFSVTQLFLGKELIYSCKFLIFGNDNEYCFVFIRILKTTCRCSGNNSSNLLKT